MRIIHHEGRQLRSIAGQSDTGIVGWALAPVHSEYPIGHINKYQPSVQSDMPMYDRSESTGIEVVDRWDGGVGWLAHPDEDAQRASHAIVGEDGVWIFDPLDGPGVDELLGEFGSVAGVALLSNTHARDATAFAKRYDVSVHMPTWMDRAPDNVDAPIEQYAAPPGEWVELGASGIRIRTVDPLTAWTEAIAYRPADTTLRVPDMLSSVPEMTVGDERIGCYFFHRFAPPHEVFADLDPERILFGHGAGVFTDAPTALDSALGAARRNLPRAVISQAPTQIRGIIGAALD